MEEGIVGEQGVEEAGGLWTGQRLGEASDGLHSGSQQGQESRQMLTAMEELRVLVGRLLKVLLW